jgi:hypothetical protein
MAPQGRERPIRRPRTMSGYIALRQAGIGHLQTYVVVRNCHLNVCC